MYDWAILALAAFGLVVVLTWDYWAKKRVPWFDERIALSEVRNLAIRRKVLVDERNQDSNPAYAIEGKLTQLAADGEPFWGRLYRVPIGNRPLVQIPEEHFTKNGFEIGHGAISDKIHNRHSSTIKGFRGNLAEGANYVDIHLMKSTALKAIKAVKKAERRSRSSPPSTAT